MTLFENIGITAQQLHKMRLADVFRFISFEPNEKYPTHQHKRIEINYVKRGKCTLNLDNESVGFVQGEMMIISPNIVHSFEAGADGATIMQLEFLPDIFSSLHSSENSTTELLQKSIFSAENRIIKIVNNVRIMRAVQRILNELTSKTQYYDYLIVMYYAELLVLIYRYVSESYLPFTENTKLKSIIYYLQTNYYKELTICELAKHAGISERYLRSLFHQSLKQTPSEFLTDYRLNKAKGLLQNTDFSIKEISYRCGFKTPQYFSRVYKLKFGNSPKHALIN